MSFVFFLGFLGRLARFFQRLIFLLLVRACSFLDLLHLQHDTYANKRWYISGCPQPGILPHRRSFEFLNFLPPSKLPTLPSTPTSFGKRSRSRLRSPFSLRRQRLSQFLRVWRWHHTTHTHPTHTCPLTCLRSSVYPSVRACPRVCLPVCLRLSPPLLFFLTVQCGCMFARCDLGMRSSFNNHNRPGPALLDHVRDNQPMEHLTDLSRAIGFCAADR